jgi:cytochrome c
MFMLAIRIKKFRYGLATYKRLSEYRFPVHRACDEWRSETAIRSIAAAILTTHVDSKRFAPWSTRVQLQRYNADALCCEYQWEMLMKMTLLTLAVAGILASSVVYGQSGADVAKQKGCLTCHEMDKKKVGPAYKDVAAKYKGDKNAESMLAAKLKEGKGHPKVAASDAELKAVLGYVLSAK